MSESLLVTIDEAARRIGLKRSFTYELIRKGQLHSVKIGGARRIVIADLERFVERAREEGEIHVDG
jgi:excisionase family DNA binding protein